MYLIAGLGNPGRQYDMTRHNIGFEVIDYMADQYNVKVKKLKFKGLYADTVIGGEKVILLKPQTFMNLSGESIQDFAAFYKIPVENIIIINDDINLAAGRLRIRAKGSAGGHNGLKSIIYRLNSDNFPRIRIGVGAKPHPDYDLADWVLSGFPKEQAEALEQSLSNAASAAELMVQGKINEAMNKFN